MAKVDLTSFGAVFSMTDSEGNPCFGFKTIGAGTAAFTCFFVQYNSNTTMYYWADSSGKLRYSATVPTTAGQGGGTAIGA